MRSSNPGWRPAAPAATAPTSPATPAPSPTGEPGARLIPLTEWPRYHPWPPLGGLRHLALHRKTNGFARCVRMVGRRLILDEAELIRWIGEQSSQAEERR